MSDGSSVFVKAGVTELTSGWLRDEHRVYGQLQAGFLPRMLGWDDDGETPILVLEDLSGAHWPPPWDARIVDAVLATLQEVHATKPPDGLVSLESHREQLASWVHVAADPQTFLELGMCSRAWLFRSVSTLIEAERRAVLEGSGLVHFDVRSDNLCLAGPRALLVDWNAACIGNVDLDVVSWIPSLMLEWGPQAEAVAPDEPELAALVAGYFAHRARLPVIPDAPRVRDVQLAQLKTSLPWAARLLGLPSPDGPARLRSGSYS